MATTDRIGGLASETTLAIKAPCLVATTGANIALAGVQTIDGVTIGNNSERVLVKDQTDPKQNNIYVASTGDWTIAPDADGNTDWTAGTLVLVTDGTANGGAVFEQTCPDSPVIIGASLLAFVARLGNQFGHYVEITGGPTPPFLDLYTAPPLNGIYMSNAGARIGFHPLTYGVQSPGIHQAAALYVKSTAAQSSALAEYMVTFDSDLNSGSTPPSTGFDAAKVGFFNSAVTGPLSADGCWAFANDMEIRAGDPGRFRVGVEFDITNDAFDFAVGGAPNAYNVFVSGLTGAFPITAQVAIAPAPNGANYSAHYGLLINGLHTADTADIEISGGAAFGLSINGLIPGTHSIAAIRDASTTQFGLTLEGTYTNSSINFGTSAGLAGINQGKRICLILAGATNAVNGVNIASAIAGTAPTVAATGSDTDIDLGLNAKGAGQIALGSAVHFNSSGSFSANASVATVLGSVGPVGSHTTVQKWLTFSDNGGVTRYVPCF